MPGHQKTRADKQGNLYRFEFELGGVGPQAFQQHEHMVVEGLYFGLMPAPLRIVYGQRVKSKMFHQHRQFGMRAVVGKVGPQNRVGLRLPGGQQGFSPVVISRVAG